MYIGRYYHKIDEKNRFSLPASFRKDIEKKAVITKGLDGCLFIFDEQTWNRTLQDAARLEFTKRNNRDFVRLLTNEAEMLEVDSHGRVLISSYLKEQATLKREIVIVGSLDRVEVWDLTHYHDYLKRIESRAETIAENITERSGQV